MKVFSFSLRRSDAQARGRRVGLNFLPLSYPVFGLGIWTKDAVPMLFPRAASEILMELMRVMLTVPGWVHPLL